jgi:putative phosphoesterase
VHLLLIADTHVPARARDLPAQVWDEVDRADVVLHAGDWVTTDLLDRVEARSRRLLAVHGNNDGVELRRRLPEVAVAELEGVRSTSSSSATATSRGTPPHPPGCVCSTPVHPRTVGVSPPAPT